jgi:hypothetical protein
MRSSVQQAMLDGLIGILKPIVRLLLVSGIGYAEFAVVAKAAFVQVASADYGIRGRPTNASRIAAMTGLSRKQVSRIRTDVPTISWSPDMEATPINTLLHHWHFDPDFSEMPGKPKALALDGDASFATLVKRYAGDIPVGALKTELCRSGLATEAGKGMLVPRKRYSVAASFSEDYLRRLAFSLRTHAGTLAYNATVRSEEEPSRPRAETRFDRVAYSGGMTAPSLKAFQQWVRSEGETFIERADNWIGSYELARDRQDLRPSPIAGVGIYFFVED